MMGKGTRKKRKMIKIKKMNENKNSKKMNKKKKKKQKKKNKRRQRKMVVLEILKCVLGEKGCWRKDSQKDSTSPPLNIICSFPYPRYTPPPE